MVGTRSREIINGGDVGDLSGWLSHLSVLLFLTAPIVQNRQEFVNVFLFAFEKTLKLIFL
jgi:hypothetical protein